MSGHPTFAMEIRAADPSEIEQLTTLWFDGWRDAHEAIVPAALTRVRTRESFRDRLRAHLPNVRVAGPPGAPLGFHIVKDDELYQLYVAASARGSGVAAALIADAEARLSAAGVRIAWLACAIGNERAARFYDKRGWRRVGTMIGQLETTAGIFPLEAWRYEKSVGPRDARVGLCAQCRHASIVTSSRGSTFYFCELSSIDPRFRRYPALPVLACEGYGPASI